MKIGRSVSSAVAAHAALDTGIHGVGASTVSSAADVAALIATHTALPNAHHTIATGSYTGDDTDDRDISIGFKCTCVIVWMFGDKNAIFIPDTVFAINDGTEKTGGSVLHATDGITVYQTTDLLNQAVNLYYYWAISE